MLLTIDEAKVRESLAATPLAYVVTSSHVCMADPGTIPAPKTIVAGTTYGIVSTIVDTREHFSALRRKIEESGVALKSVDELSKEIDEMRGRSI
jgi:hypothetical protein